MRARSLAVSLGLIATAVAFTGCGYNDGPSSPTHAQAPRPTGASATLLASAITVTPLNRTTPLASPITVSKTIGILGGAISVPGTGLTLTVPPLAVSGNTIFTVTALAGSAVAYDFAPHRTFNVPLVLTQDLHNTAVESGLVNPLDLFVGYFANTNDITSVTETLGVSLNLQSLLATTTVSHFSGYIFAGGRSGDE